MLKSKANTGHGHVRIRPDGAKARCGGPALCSECAKENASLILKPVVIGSLNPGEQFWEHQINFEPNFKAWVRGHGEDNDVYFITQGGFDLRCDASTTVWIDDNE